MTYGTAPVLNGVTLPRPTESAEAPEQVGADVTLASGRIVRYDRGVRFTTALSWPSATGVQRATILAAYSRGACSFTGVDGIPRTVLLDPPQIAPIAGTDPVQFAITLAVREQSPRL